MPNNILGRTHLPVSTYVICTPVTELMAPAAGPTAALLFVCIITPLLLSIKCAVAILGASWWCCDCGCCCWSSRILFRFATSSASLLFSLIRSVTSSGASSSLYAFAFVVRLINCASELFFCWLCELLNIGAAALGCRGNRDADSSFIVFGSSSSTSTLSVWAPADKLGRSGYSERESEVTICDQK